MLETLTGETLSHLIHRLRRRPAADDLALLGLHLCSAMHYLHGQGLLHLDVKPSNIVVDCRRAKVLDLSIARAPGPAPAGIGTFCYLAPEQARGGTLSPAADVWGIGITMYEAATGDVPFDSGETYGEICDEICDESGDEIYGESGHPGQGAVAADSRPHDAGGEDYWYPQLEERAPSVGSLRRLPRGLAAALDSCLEPDPDARPTIAELAAVLDGLLPQGRRHVPLLLAD